MNLSLPPLLWRAGLRHLGHHPWQLLLALLGLALGVAVVVAVDLANASARQGFELSVEQVSGRTTHRITAGTDPLAERLYVDLRLAPGPERSAPLVSGFATLPQGGLVRLLGVDPLAEGPFRDYLAGGSAGSHVQQTTDLAALLTEPGTALAPAELVRDGRLELRVGPRALTLRVVGTFQDPARERLVVTDIATAQELLDRIGLLDQIDLIVPDNRAGMARLEELRRRLPAGVTLESMAESNAATAQLTASFQLNLTAMSLLALVVGMFLIYNAMTFSVIQRRGLLGMLRALGVSRREVLTLILGEALVLGLVGTLLGLGLGILLATLLVDLVTRTINDLYYVLTVNEFRLSLPSLVKALGLGLVASLVAAWLPAREAAGVTPGSALSRAHLEQRWRLALPWLLLTAMGLLGVGALLLILTRGLIGGFAGIFLVILGSALITPGWLLVLATVAQALVRQRLLARMAARDLGRHLSRTAVAAAALMVAFAATVGVGVMVDSFRGGVQVWIEDLLTADLYIAPPGFEGGSGERHLEPALVAALADMPGVAGVATYGYDRVTLGGRPVSLMALTPAPATRSGYRFSRGDPATAWQGFDQGHILISEPLAYRLGLGPGDPLTLPTDRGPRDFTVAGVFHDYGSEHGRVLLARQTYDAHWQGGRVGSAAVYVAPDRNPADLRRELERRLAPLQTVMIRSNRDIRDLTLAVFDRTFTITRVLRLLAVGVAFIGVFSALMALQLERAREFAVLRATGMTIGEVGRLVSWQTALLGLGAGLLALPVGLGLAWLLIHVINRRAFGWTMPFIAEPGQLLQAVVLAVVAALLAGAYPIWRMTRSTPAAALRSE